MDEFVKRLPSGKKKMTYSVVNDALPTDASSSEGDFINASGEIAGETTETYYDKYERNPVCFPRDQAEFD